MSFPPDKTYLQNAMMKIDKPLVIDGVPTIHYYVKEIKYLQEEINYWTTEYQLNPNETKLNKINQLTGELESIKNTYQKMYDLLG
jgi:hypothetical protein